MGTERLIAAVAVRPAAPGLMVVVGLLGVAISGWRVTSAAWFWPACAALMLLAVVLNTIRQDVWRRVQSHEHKHRMDTANALLNDENSAGSTRELATLRELGSLVERFGHKLDDLLAEVHAEKSSAEQRSNEQRSHRS
jgi:ABC-type nickel/cobalt efflux system permease component RcnA